MARLNMNPCMQRGWIANASTVLRQGNDESTVTADSWAEAFDGSPVAADFSWTGEDAWGKTGGVGGTSTARFLNAVTADTSWADEGDKSEGASSLWAPARPSRSTLH